MHPSVAQVATALCAPRSICVTSCSKIRTVWLSGRRLLVFLDELEAMARRPCKSCPPAPRKRGLCPPSASLAHFEQMIDEGTPLHTRTGTSISECWLLLAPAGYSWFSLTLLALKHCWLDWRAIVTQDLLLSGRNRCATETIRNARAHFDIMQLCTGRFT